MLDFFRQLFSSDFMAHGYCYLWDPTLVWLHVGSDTLIVVSYYLIPMTLLYFVKKRKDLPFNWMFILFGVFILGCGTTHAMEVWTIWHGTYRLAGVIKAVTAAASIVTAALLIPLMPKALALPSPEELRRVNAALEDSRDEQERRLLELEQKSALLREINEQLRTVSAQLESAKEDEGIRIARDIHDVLGSELTSLKWRLESFSTVISEAIPAKRAALQEKMAGIIQLADTSITSIRRIASQLRPSLLGQRDLIKALEGQVSQFEVQTGIPCRLNGSLEDVELTDEQSIAVLRIVQEALTNVRRHAHATLVQITAAEDVDRLFCITIRDNGNGIKEDAKADPHCLGLLGMQERAHLIKGELTIAGSVGEGTVIKLRGPRTSNEKKSAHH